MLEWKCTSDLREKVPVEVVLREHSTMPLMPKYLPTSWLMTFLVLLDCSMSLSRKCGGRRAAGGKVSLEGSTSGFGRGSAYPMHPQVSLKRGLADISRTNLHMPAAASNKGIFSFPAESVFRSEFRLTALSSLSSVQARSRSLRKGCRLLCTAVVVVIVPSESRGCIFRVLWLTFAVGSCGWARQMTGSARPTNRPKSKVASRVVAIRVAL